MVKIAGESRSPWASLWPLDPAIAYLNHGSFGACPTAILEKQSELRLRLEREPVDFLVRALPDGSETNRVRNNSAAPLDLILDVSGYFR
jgi:hypothetical protein